jgi:hypothetical protein
MPRHARTARSSREDRINYAGNATTASLANYQIQWRSHDDVVCAMSGSAWTRTHIDAIWRACPMVILPGTRRPVLRAEDYLAYLEEHTYRNDQPRSSRLPVPRRPSSRVGGTAIQAAAEERVTVSTTQPASHFTVV